MTGIMARGGRAATLVFVDTTQAVWLGRVTATHRWLARQAEERLSTPEAILQFGLAVLAYAHIEERWLFELSNLLDPAVVARLRDEHERLSDDLELLESLSDGPQERSDRAILAASLFERLRDHVRREERLIYEPLGRTDLLGASPAAGA
jgi:hemerythrin HHE cation binding domain-containing protein